MAVLRIARAAGLFVGDIAMAVVWGSVSLPWTAALVVVQLQAVAVAALHATVAVERSRTAAGGPVETACCHAQVESAAMPSAQAVPAVFVAVPVVMAETAAAAAADGCKLLDVAAAPFAEPAR